jgi:hypothetical protein
LDDGALTRPVDYAAVPGSEDGGVLTRVYAAALAASGSQAVAEQVSERIMLAARGDATTTLVERAVLLAIRTSPDSAFMPMGAEEREAIALARLAGASTGRVATVLGVEPAEVRARMRRGLRALVSRDGAPRTPPPRRDCGCGASPAHAAHAS